MNGDVHERPIYPSNGEFQLKVKTVEAMCYDGTTANAYEILAWVHRNQGVGHLKSGYADQGPDLLFVGSDGKQVPEGSWVVKSAKGFEIWSDEDFRATYEPIPEKGPVYRG